MYVVGLPDADPDRPRLVEPELRSRVVGYLATAPEVGPDHRTDGVWVWPAALVDHHDLGAVVRVEHHRWPRLVVTGLMRDRPSSP